LHLFTKSNEQLIAYCRIIPPGIIYKNPVIGRVVVHSAHRNKKIATQLMQHAIDELWMFTGEMTTPSATENEALAAGIAPDLLLIKPLWEAKIEAILSEATLSKPTATWMQQGGKNGKHSEYLGYVLTEMQYLQRSYPNAKW